MNFFERKMFPTANSIETNLEKGDNKINQQEMEILKGLNYDIFNLTPVLENEIKLEHEELFNEILKLKSHIHNTQDWFKLTTAEKRLILSGIGYDDFAVNSIDSDLNDYYLKRLQQMDGFIEMYEKHPDKEKRDIFREYNIKNVDDWMNKNKLEKDIIIKKMGFDVIEDENEMDEKVVNNLFPYLKM